MNRLTILGSGYAIPSQSQENSYLLMQSEKHAVLVDCGNNPVSKLQQSGVTLNEITDLILTHAHPDHMGTLPLLLLDMWLLKRESPLNIYGLPYTLERAKALLTVFDYEKWADMFTLNFVPVSDQVMQKVIDADDLKVTTGPVVHLIPTIGVRVEFPATGKTIAYSCDGEPSLGVDRLAKGATILIQEAAGPAKGHTSPAEAGINAARAGVDELVLIHYDATRPESELVNEAKKQFNGKVVAAKDLLIFE
jgi:ribonuclease Z